MKEETSLKLIKLIALLQSAVYTIDDLQNDKVPKEIESILNSTKPVFKEVEKIITKKYKTMLERLFNVDEDMIMTIVEAYQYQIDTFKELSINDVVTIK